MYNFDQASDHVERGELLIGAPLTPVELANLHDFASLIRLIRGQRVILDSDLAVLYGVRTEALVQAVKRNLDRFPTDFMFRLHPEEHDRLRSQTVISKPGRGGRRYAPYAFTEHGVAMLASVLRSDRAIAVNIEVVRAFIRLRGLLAENADLARRLYELEQRYDKQFKSVFDAIRELTAAPLKRASPIGFRPGDPD